MGRLSTFSDGRQQHTHMRTVPAHTGTQPRTRKVQPGMRTRGVEAVHEVLAHKGSGARHHRCRHGRALQAGRRCHACRSVRTCGWISWPQAQQAVTLRRRAAHGKGCNTGVLVPLDSHHPRPLTAMVVRPQSSALPSPAAAEVMVPGARMSGFTRLSVVGPVCGVGARGCS